MEFPALGFEIGNLLHHLPLLGLETLTGPGRNWHKQGPDQVVVSRLS